MNMFMSHPYRPMQDEYAEHAFWATGQVPMMGPPAQPNQVIYPIFTTLPENRPRLTRDQWERLEAHYQQERKPSTATKRVIAQTMNVPLEKINNWFQNRRAKERQEDKKAKAAAVAAAEDAAARGEVASPESLNGGIPVAEQQSVPSRPVSQPVGPVHPSSSLTPARLSTCDLSPAQSQPLLPSPAEELDCVIQNGIPATLSEDGTGFDAIHFVNPPVHTLFHGVSMPGMPSESLPNGDVYPSPVQTVFSSPEQQFLVTSQSVPTSASVSSASQSPDQLHPMLSHDFSQSIPADNILSSGPSVPHIPIVSKDLPVPNIAFSHGESDEFLSSALAAEDYAPFFGGLSGPSTPTYPGPHFNELQSISSQATTNVGTTASDFPSQTATFLEPYDDSIMNNSSSISLPNQSLEQLMPPPEGAKMLKPRQSSQPNLATRRRKNAPGAIQIGPVGSMGRSGSYTCGMPHPLSPRSPHLAAPDQALRRIKSSNNNTTGRIQKPMTPSQRSPYVFTFAQNAHLLDTQTPPPSASIVEAPSASLADMPTVSNVAYPNAHSMFSDLYSVPWSAPPTQQSFMFHADGPTFSSGGVLPSTPSPTSQPQLVSS